MAPKACSSAIGGKASPCSRTRSTASLTEASFSLCFQDNRAMAASPARRVHHIPAQPEDGRRTRLVPALERASPQKRTAGEFISGRCLPQRNSALTKTRGHHVQEWRL